MHEKVRRFLVLLLVFCVAFITVFVIRSIQSGNSLIDIIKRPFISDDRQDGYTLRDQPSIDLKDVQVLAAINAESAALVRSVVPSVVSIDTAGISREPVQDFYGRTWVQKRAVQGQGSGVIVTEEGHVLTNHHVIVGKSRIRLTMHDGSVHSARVIGTDPAVDIAVLKIEGKGPFQPLKFGDSSEIEVGNTVFAIGSPFGLGTSVTEGKISAKKRPFSDSQVDLLQTSAATNPGNSGGPLINILGEIVGINSRIYSTDRDSPGFQGIGFAIPSNAALKTMKDILDRGHPVRGFLGMAMEDVDPMTREELGLEVQGGVRVVALVPGSPALRAGLRKDDVILRYQGEPARSMRRLIARIQQSKVGEEVNMRVWRDQSEIDVKAVIGEADDFMNGTKEVMKSRVDIEAILQAIGLDVRAPTFIERSNGMRGVVITRVYPQSPLKGQLITGDIIREINGRPITSVKNFQVSIAASVSLQNTELAVQRGRSIIQVKIAPIRTE